MTNIDETVASIAGNLSPSAEVNIRALAVSLALQLVDATNNNVEATYKFIEISKVIHTIINDKARLA